MAPTSSPPPGAPIHPLVVVTDRLVLLPAGVTDPRSGTLNSPTVVVVGLAAQQEALELEGLGRRPE